jgi:hypothetical protein
MHEQIRRKLPAPALEVEGEQSAELKQVDQNAKTPVARGGVAA